MSEVPDKRPSTPDSLPPIPPIAAEPKAMESPVMVRTVEDKVQPTDEREAADIQEDVKKHAGQRMINSIWEVIQATIALSVVWTGAGVCAVLALRTEADERTQDAAIAALLFLTGAGNLVIGFYFGRTNHQRVGGVGGDTQTGGR